MAQVSLWDRVLSPSQVSAMAGCRDPGRGNLFSSDTFSLEEVGVRASQHSLPSLCQHTQHHVVFPEERTLGDARSLCRRLNASLAVPTSADDNQRLADQLPAFHDACVPTAAWKLWLGITDRAEDGVWRKFHNNEQISYSNFPPVNAASSYFCASMKLDGFWDGDRCANRRCAACHVQRSTFLYLRGLCFDTKFRMRFRTQGYIDGRPFFRGYYDKVMLWQEQHKQWAVVDAVTNATLLATQAVADNDYPLGRHSWEAWRGLCGHPRGAVVPLSLSPCEDNEFTCSTGDCVPRGLRCDFRYDCSDGSDEEMCGVVELKDHLQKELPPPGVDGGPLTVTPSLTLSRIADVDDIAMAVTLEFRVSLVWTDSRLRMRHLRLNKNGTILTEADAQNVWQPRYSLVNLEGGTQQRLGHSLVVTSSSGAALPPYNSVDMGE
ncbi:SCO-spondin [Portunus trituberculatus]|uniref:SCO-spondin n=1 Tax=Portunus trituberculatus TaxID=210409 RepID=A0A5B7IDW3_PORTR|nr:SCO-spondin [Portunus trituberculatus]